MATTFDSKLFARILGLDGFGRSGLRVAYRQDLDGVELSLGVKTAVIPARDMRRCESRGDWEGFGDMVRQAWEDAGVEARYLTRPVPRLGMGTLGDARRRMARVTRAACDE